MQNTTRVAPYNIVFGQHPNMGLSGITDGGHEEPNAETSAEPTQTTTVTSSLTTSLVVTTTTENGNVVIERSHSKTVTMSQEDAANNDDDATDNDEDDLEEDFNIQQETRASQRSQMCTKLDSRKRISREKMIKMHNNKRNKQTFDFKVGDIVSVLIPSVDRGHCDNKRLPCIVKEALKKANHILYILQCKFGILEQGYLAKEIEMYLGALEMPAIDSFPVNKTTKQHEYPKLSLRSAAAFAAKHTTDLGLSQLMCNCTKNCDTNYCVCKKASQKCTSHCHNKLTSTRICTNK